MIDDALSIKAILPSRLSPLTPLFILRWPAKARLVPGIPEILRVRHRVVLRGGLLERALLLRLALLPRHQMRRHRRDGREGHVGRVRGGRDAAGARAQQSARVLPALDERRLGGRGAQAVVEGAQRQRRGRRVCGSGREVEGRGCRCEVEVGRVGQAALRRRVREGQRLRPVELLQVVLGGDGGAGRCRDGARVAGGVGHVEGARERRADVVGVLPVARALGPDGGQAQVAKPLARLACDGAGRVRARRGRGKRGGAGGGGHAGVAARRGVHVCGIDGLHGRGHAGRAHGTDWRLADSLCG